MARTTKACRSFLQVRCRVFVSHRARGGGANRLQEVGRNTYRYPNTYVVDMRLATIFQLGERFNLQFLAEGFNLANHRNVTGIANTGYIIGSVAGVPTLTYNSPFGTVNNANSNFAHSTRQIQIGAKLRFLAKAGTNPICHRVPANQPGSVFSLRCSSSPLHL